MAQVSEQRADVAEAARVLAALGLVTAFGHVSARAGDDILITPAADLATVTPADLITIPARTGAPGGPPGLPPGAPAEAWAHLAVYQARPDLGAVARAQPPSAFAVTATTPELVPLHGQAAWLGPVVPVHGSAILLRSPHLARAAADRLRDGEALLLRGNGALTVGADPGLAVARMWLLAAACDTWLAARAAGPVTPLAPAEIEAWRSAGVELLPRLWQHLRRRAAAPPDHAAPYPASARLHTGSLS
jgi:HCOMODA/2-hydroxy-3-carboxy-muconic semialdehyde decarboxylase